MAATSLSRKILIGIWIIVIVGWLLPMVMETMLRYTALVPQAIYPGMQLWRLVSYPISAGLIGMILGSIAFSSPGEELETMFGTRHFGALLLGMVLLGGIMHFAIFLEPNTVLHGFENIALFVLVGYVYLFPQSEVRILFFSIRSWLVLTVAGAVVLSYSIVLMTQGASPLLFFSYGGFGLLVGGAYFHARYQKYPFLLRPIRSLERAAERVSTPAGARTPVAARKVVGAAAPKAKGGFRGVPREVSDEERLNIILDTINEKGYGALSEEEQRFLRDYSSKL